MPKFDLNCVFHFAASHFLTQYHGKCENMHGHNYKLIVTVSGEMKDDGMVIDYKKIKEIVNTEIIKKLDHTHLNDILENPSSENLLIYIWKNLKLHLSLKKLRLYETENYFCDYAGE